MAFMPLAACSEAVLNPLSLVYFGFGLRDHFPNFDLSPFSLKNGCFDFALLKPKLSTDTRAD
jgi:hypothetical protein